MKKCFYGGYILFIAIITAIFGFGDFAEGVADIAQILFHISLILFVVSLFTGRGRTPEVQINKE